MAVTALAQQTAPAAADAEKALRARAEQFYQLEVDGKFRQAEALVAEDSKDYYFNNGKPRIRSFQIGKIEFQDDGTRAVVTLIAKVIMTAPGLSAAEVPVTARHTWKFENGDWSWYIDQKAEIDTPFGKMRPAGADANGSPAGLPDFTKPLGMVSIDRTSVDLSNGTGKVTITNHLPGSISLRIGNHPQGLIVEVDKSQLAQGENAVISFRAAEGAKPSGEAHFTALPIGQEFVVKIVQ
jgi:hypothetical protein